MKKTFLNKVATLVLVGLASELGAAGLGICENKALALTPGQQELEAVGAFAGVVLGGGLIGLLFAAASSGGDDTHEREMAKADAAHNDAVAKRQSADAQSKTLLSKLNDQNGKLALIVQAVENVNAARSASAR